MANDDPRCLLVPPSPNYDVCSAPSHSVAGSILCSSTKVTCTCTTNRDNKFENLVPETCTSFLSTCHTFLLLDPLSGTIYLNICVILNFQSTVNFRRQLKKIPVCTVQKVTPWHITNSCGCVLYKVIIYYLHYIYIYIIFLAQVFSCTSFLHRIEWRYLRRRNLNEHNQICEVWLVSWCHLSYLLSVSEWVSE